VSNSAIAKGDSDAMQAVRLREADLEARLNDLSAFAGNLAQELKTPLQVIGMAASALERDVRAETPDRARLIEGTRALAEMTRRATAVASALRTLAHRGRAIQPSAVSVAELFGNAEALTHGRYQQAGVALTFRNTAKASPAGRPADLMRITMDLLEHALESAQGADVATERWVRLEARDADGQVVIRCVDGGPRGVPEAQAGMDAPTDPTSAAGTRALRIARVLAERATGTLRAVAGEPHRTFEVRLPTLA
jgi:signal transduction histidine kinase